MVPKRTGEYGGRNVVVPIAAGDTPRSSAIAPIALTFAVLPWSMPIPTVV